MSDRNNDTKRAADLLHLLLDDATDHATREAILAWFWSDVSGEAKDAAMLELFRQMKPNPSPDELDYRKYAELTALLNINGKARTATREKRTPPLLLSPMRIAASVVLLLGLGLAYFWFNGTAGTGDGRHIAEVTVSAGPSPRTIELPDGSSIELAANSALTYGEDFTSCRRVHLDGEALLSVESSTDEAGEKIPFSVTTDDLEVDVLGTVFKVVDHSDDRDDRSLVVLYEGTVSVTANDTTVALQPGETYRFDHATRMPNTGLILAREMVEHGFMPLLRFDESTLGNLVTALAANYGVKFVMPEDIDLSRGKFSGDFHGEDLKSTLNILTKSSAKLSFVQNGDKVVVKRK